MAPLYLSMALLTFSTVTFAFTTTTTTTTGILHSRRHSSPTFLVRQDDSKPISSSSSTRRHALIYGWDGDDDDDENSSNTFLSSGAVEVGSQFDLGGAGQCSPAGVQVAEALSYDPDRVGALARLAVAFSPPERALSLDAIEKVDVICVAQDHIDIQAIVCEDGGCVSLSVPVQFPYHCEDNPEWLEGCVTRNLEQLDESATSVLQSSPAGDGGDHAGDLCLLDASTVKLPDWWIPPGCDETMSAECEHMRGTLNADEFSTEIIALAHDSLHNAGEQYSVQAAKVAAVGPAGLCFKVLATPANTIGSEQVVLDVLYPFGQHIDSIEGMRAAVLGAVATAEG